MPAPSPTPRTARLATAVLLLAAGALPGAALDASPGPGPDAPAGLTALGKPGRIELAWQQGGLVDHVYRGQGSCGDAILIRDVLLAEAWTDTGVQPGVLYCYFIADDGGPNATARSNEASAVALPPPDLAVTALEVEGPRLASLDAAGLSLWDPVRARGFLARADNLGPGASEAPAGFRVEVCAREPIVPSPCEVLAHATFSALEPGGWGTLSGRWDPARHLGDFDLCAALEYAFFDADPANNARCVPAAAVIGGLGHGVALR